MPVQTGRSSRVPVVSTALPVQYAQDTVTPELVAKWETWFQRIPQAIRDEMCKPYIDNYGSLNRFVYRFGLNPWLVEGEGFWPGYSVEYAGLYGGPGDTRLTYNRVGIVAGSGYEAESSTLIHEFGHHIDQTFRRLRGLDDTFRPNTALRFHAPFSTTWAELQASIPIYLYGATNILEWMAEQWRTQISGDGSTFLALMAGDRSVADRIRAEWVSMFPSMPAFSY
jgi:hypothetical protein